MNLRDVMLQQWWRPDVVAVSIALLVAVAVLWLAIEVLTP